MDSSMPTCRLASQRPVMGFSLCLPLLLLLLLSASSSSSSSSSSVSTVPGEMDGPSNVSPPDHSSQLLRFLRSLAVLNRLKGAVTTDVKMARAERLLQKEKRATSKRGFGIAGLDNVDMITSTLDRSRSRSRSRQRPQMSMSVNLNQLRALMAKAG
ncbi:uncharacterized protein LOC143286441 [Babylonia areolata]|uniref:uncharacterized protein LOC143286441 n=1 Tax=Babylonia areolata TaxID=304850 RepID=UPI003FCFA056